MGVAAKLVRERQPEDCHWIQYLDERLLGHLLKSNTVLINGKPDRRVSGILNVHFSGVQAESLMLALGDIAVSAGSACTSHAVEPSHVLLALGLGEDRALSSLRISIGRFSTEEEIDLAGIRIQESALALRSLAA